MCTSEIQDRGLGVFGPERIRRDERRHGEEQSEPWGLELGPKGRHQPQIRERPARQEADGASSVPSVLGARKGKQVRGEADVSSTPAAGGQLGAQLPAGFPRENRREQPPGPRGKSLSEKAEKKWRSGRGRSSKGTAGILTSTDRKNRERGRLSQIFTQLTRRLRKDALSSCLRERDVR